MRGCWMEAGVLLDAVEPRIGEEAAAEEEQLKSSSYSEDPTAFAYDDPAVEPDPVDGTVPPLIGSKEAAPSLSVLIYDDGPGSVSTISSSVSPSRLFVPSVTKVAFLLLPSGSRILAVVEAGERAERREAFCVAIWRAVQCARFKSEA